MIEVAGCLLALIGVGFLGWYLEKRAWNDGICKSSGKPWTAFGMDSGGAVGFKDGENNIVWISWPGIIKNN